MMLKMGLSRPSRASKGMSDRVSAKILSFGMMLVLCINITMALDLVAQLDTGAAIPYQSTISNGYVYFGNDAGTLYKVDASDVSKVIATYNITANPSASPAVSDKYVYIPAQNGYIYQLNVADLTFVANYSTGTFTGGSPDKFFSTPAISKDFIYIGSDNGYVYELSASNISREVAKHLTDSMIQSSPTVSNGYVYVGGNDCTLHQLSAVNINNEVATFYGSAGGYVSTPMVYNGYVYFGNWNSEVYQLNASNINKKKATFYTMKQITTPLASANGYIYAGGPGNNIYQLNASDIQYEHGGLIATYDISPQYTTSNIVVSNNNLYAVYGYTLYQLNASNVSQNPIDTKMIGTKSSYISAGNNNIYVSGNNGILYQFYTPCVEQWVLRLTACTEKHQTKEYIDLSSCGTTNYLPSDSGTTVACESDAPSVSFCEDYDSNVPTIPYEGAIYSENENVPQAGCFYDSNPSSMRWSSSNGNNSGYSISYNIADMASFQNPIAGRPDVYFINNEVPASKIFSQNGRYNLTVLGIDTYGSSAEKTVGVYYDTTPPEIEFCSKFGGVTPTDGSYLTNDSELWMDVCVDDLTWKDVTVYLVDKDETTWLQDYRQWDGEDCTSRKCGFAHQFTPLSDYMPSDGIYVLQADATDRANHDRMTAPRTYYYDTTPPIFTRGNIEDNSVLTTLNFLAYFNFDERTMGSMVAEIYYANGTRMNRYPLTNCKYCSSSGGYRFFDDNGITCAINLLNTNISSNGEYSMVVSYTDGVNLTGKSETIDFRFDCTENWVQNGLMCVKGVPIISYTDTHSCGTTRTLPSDNGTVSKTGACYYQNNPVISDCGTIMEQGRYTMNKSIVNTTTTCIFARAYNIDLDCLGYTITGNLMVYDSANITLNHCQINGSIKIMADTTSAASNEGSLVIENSSTRSVINEPASSPEISLNNSVPFGENLSREIDEEEIYEDSEAMMEYNGSTYNGSKISIYNSTIDEMIIADEEEGGTITIVNSRIDFDANINAGAGKIILEYAYLNNEFGEIQFSHIETNETDFRSIMRITNNSAYVDGTHYPDYNVPSIVTLNLSDWNISDPVIEKDGTVCTDCNILGFEQGLVIFSVTNWGNYRVVERGQELYTGSLLSGSSRKNNATNSSNTTCEEKWHCDAWSRCSRFGASARNCIDASGCGTTGSKPLTITFCEPKEDKSAIIASAKAAGQALFDIILDIIKEPTSNDNSLLTKITLVNFGSSKEVTAELNYTLMDSSRAIVRQMHKSVPVTTQAEFIENINTTGLIVGKYYLAIDLKYAGQEYAANTEDTFKIRGKNSLVSIMQSASGKMNIGTKILIIILIAWIIGGAAFFWYKKRSRRFQNITPDTSNGHGSSPDIIDEEKDAKHPDKV